MIEIIYKTDSGNGIAKTLVNTNQIITVVLRDDILMFFTNSGGEFEFREEELIDMTVEEIYKRIKINK